MTRSNRTVLAANRRSTLRNMTLFAAAVLSLGGGAVRAQDDLIADEAQNAQAELQNFAVADANFDQWVFGGRGNESEVKKQANNRLKVQVESISRDCHLNEDQKKRLFLAGQADIKRFFDRVALLRKKFNQVKNDQNKFNQFWQDIQPVQVEFTAGLFGVKSYFRKTVNNLLTAEQSSDFVRGESDRRVFNYRSKVTLVVSNFDDLLALRGEQRKQLIDLLSSPRHVPKTFGIDTYAMYAVMYQCSQADADRLAKILDKPQLELFQKAVNPARGYVQFLKQYGYSWEAAAGDDRPADLPADAEVKAEAAAGNSF